MMARYQNYQLLKANWIRKNPFATTQKYQKAITKLARKYGV